MRRHDPRADRNDAIKAIIAHLANAPKHGSCAHTGYPLVELTDLRDFMATLADRVGDLFVALGHEAADHGAEAPDTAFRARIVEGLTDEPLFWIDAAINTALQPYDDSDSAYEERRDAMMEGRL